MKTTIKLLMLLPVLLFLSTSYAQQAKQLPDLIVQDIEIKGNSKTKAGVIQHYLTFEKQEAISTEKIESSRRQLNATGFFKNVEIYTRPGSEKGSVIAVIEIEERRRPYFQFGGGHSDLDGWYFIPASIRFDNQFGYGNLVDIQLFFSDRTSKIALNYKKPFLFEGSTWFGAQAFSGSRRYLHYLNGLQAQQDVNFGGLKLHLGGNDGFFRFITLGLQTENFKPADELKFTENDSVVSGIQVPVVLRPMQEVYQVSAFTLALRYDGRDNHYYPRRGFWGAVIYEKATTELNTEVQFSRLLLDARFYQNILADHVFAFNLKGAYASDDTPFFKRYYLGGANSLRGFAERRLTPVGYGTKLLLGNFEYRFPFSRSPKMEPSIFGVLFYNLGGLWNGDARIVSDDLFHSLGFGLRFKLPILGLVRMDFAFPTTIIEKEDFQLHFSLGQTF
ncbi:MAG: BamA/TamA family outer membrane protein [Deferribacteres bacterium]|nr:BamA/TamA family outer membrane protein [candidate division KSB1 bacterium]MCB9502202.1 BamA/TamA family outer membrane protein [Deferribacteres bacterium]